MKSREETEALPPASFSCDNAAPKIGDQNMNIRIISISAVIALPLLFITARPQPAIAHPQTSQDKSTGGCWTYPDSLDALIADPQNHTVVYDDANVQLLDVHTPPGTTNSLHDHHWSSVFVNIEAQPRGRDHKADGSVTQPGGVVPADALFPLLNVAGPQGPHAYENLDTFTKHFYRLQFKKVPFRCPQEFNGQFQDNARRSAVTTLPPVEIADWIWPVSMEQVATSPQTDKVLADNADFRFIEVTIPPGRKQNMGTHQLPSALFFFEVQPKGTDMFSDAPSEGIIGKDTQFRLVNRSFEDAVFPTAIRMGPQPPHSFENTDTIPAHYYRMEFKKIKYKG